MSNNPLDFPKSKIPVPESPYLSASRSGFLADLSDQVFFDENVPTPVDPLSKRPKSPPYSYGPPGILHDPSSMADPSVSPRGKKGRRRKPPEITASEYVESRLEELLGPTASYDVDDTVDDILIDSIKRRGSKEKDPSLYPTRYSERDRGGRRRASPISKSQSEGIGDSLSVPGDSDSASRRDRGDTSKGLGRGGSGRLKDNPLSRPESRSSDKPLSRPPSDKPGPSASIVPPTIKNPVSPKKSPLKSSLKIKDINAPIKEVKLAISDPTQVVSETRKKVQESLTKTGDAASQLKDKVAITAAAAATAGGAAAATTAAALTSKVKSDLKEKAEGDKEKDKSQKPGPPNKGDEKGKEKEKENGKESPKKDADPEPKPAFSGTDIHGHAGVDFSKMDDSKKEEYKRDYAAGMKLLQQCKTGDWYGVEGQLKFFEKKVASGLNVNHKPLSNIKEEGTGWTPLMYAIKDNRTALGDRMIELGCDVNAKAKAHELIRFLNKRSDAEEILSTEDFDGLHPIHVAALHGRDDTVRFLIFKKADVEVVTEPKKQNVLHVACSRSSGNSASILRALLAVMPKDARLQKDADGNIPIFVALKTGLRGACQELLTTQANEQLKAKAGPHEDTPLHVAVRKRDLEVARIFVDTGANVDATNGIGQTPLHLASELGDENLVKFFYLCKANPNIADKEDRTPIHLAAMQGHTQIIELLADKFKVSVFERTRDGSTLMHIASLHGHPETAMALFRKGVPLQMPNKGGARSLHIAARHGHAAMISKLLEKGEKVDAVTNDNFTALHIAVEAVRPNVVETLLGYGAQVHIKGGKDKETPLHIAARVMEGEKCALMLLKSGADPNITMENGETPLHVAAKHGRLRIIRLLLQDGGNPQQKAKEGETPLHFACAYGHLRVVKELLEYVKKQKSKQECMLYINTVTARGESALHYAARLNTNKIDLQGSEQNLKKEDMGRDIVKLLLDSGASVSRQTRETHETPFHYVAKEGNNDILKEMLSRMTPVECQRALNKQSSKGWSPLLIACHKGHTQVVRTLLENNARVDVFDQEGRSALHLAAENGFQEICGILLEHKAFINAKSRVGLTALHLAGMKGFSRLCIFLIQDHGAYVDALTLKKQTPLHLAAETGQLEVCRLLMGLRANPDAADEKGQKPIHLAAQNNHAEVIKLFLKHQNSLVSSSTKDGSTCAHLAAMQGSVAVLEELMKFDKTGVITARNRSTDATALQLAAEGGHSDLVKSLIDAGASANDENRAGYTAVHLAAKNGHTNVLESLRNSEAISQTSRKLGMNALHIAAFYGQTETVRELLQNIQATSVTEPPLSAATSFIKELGTESGLTPLHLASYSGEENVVRLLLNFEGVQVDAPTANLGFNPLHLACRGGHSTVVGLLLSRSSELLESKDASGKSGLHIAAIHGHKQMVEVLLGQGAEIDAIDKELWTPLICASKAGHLEVVKLLIESGASPLAKTSKGHSAIWFAAAENHNDVLSYLMKKEHDTYGLMEDKDFVFNLTVCGKNIDNEPIDEFVLSSPAPADVAAKLSNILVNLSSKEKERAKDLIAASKHCEAMAAELLALAAGSESAGKVLESIDRKGVEFLDVLIENEQKEVIAHTVVQRYLQEIWVGHLTWADWKLLLLFFCFVFIPPVWIAFSLPFGHKYHKIPIIKFMSYLTSHLHLMILFCLTCVTPIYPVFPIRTNLFPFWFEWMLLAWLLGLLVAEIMNPSDKGGLGWIKVAVLVFSIMGIMLHGVAFFLNKQWYGTILYLRDQLLGMAVLLACVQILDFLSFHYLFGPWAIIIGNLMKDLARFLAVLMIFMVGFSLVMSALNHPIHPRRALTPEDKPPKTLTNGLPSGVLVTPIDAFELLFFALFGLNGAGDLKIEILGQPDWTLILFKVFFGVYMLVTVVVLINLLIAMMSDTYQRIQAQSDIEWKYGLAKLIRSMHRTSATPSPINLIVSPVSWVYKKCKKAREPFNPLKWEAKGSQAGAMQKGGAPFMPFKEKPTPKQRWQLVFKKTQMTPRVSDIMRLSVAQVSPMVPGTPMHGQTAVGSTLSVGNQQRIETVTDWPLIAKKYRLLVGKEEPVTEEAPSDGQGSRKDSTQMSSMMLMGSKS